MQLWRRDFEDLAVFDRRHAVDGFRGDVHPLARQVVRAMRIPETARLASRALKAATVTDVEKVLAESLAEVKSS